VEHRWSIRKPYECSVAVSAMHRGSAIGVMRNIGLGGTFVDTGGLFLPVYAPLRLAFVLIDEDEAENAFRLHGMVVRRTTAGVGIMFLETSADMPETLHRALYPEARIPAAAGALVLAGRGGFGHASHVSPAANR
jgi:PilZ domain